MKIFLLFLIFSILITFQSCHPKPDMTGRISLAFHLSNTNSTIPKKDTLKLLFSIPVSIKLFNGSNAKISSLIIDPTVTSRIYQGTDCDVQLSNTFIHDNGLSRTAQFYPKGIIKDSFRFEGYFVSQDTGDFELEIGVQGFIRAKSSQGDINIDFDASWAAANWHLDLLEAHCPKLVNEPYFTAHRNGRHYAFRRQ